MISKWASYIALVMMVFLPMLVYAQNADSLLSIAEDLKYNKPDSAKAIFTNIRNQTDFRLHPERYLKAQHGMAAIEYIQSRYVNAMSLFKKGYEDALAIKDQKYMALSRNGLGLILLGQKRYEEALVEFEASLKINRERNDGPSIGNNLFNMGITLSSQHREEEALKSFNEALQLIDPSAQGVLYLMCKNHRAKTLSKMGRLDEAEEIFLEVLQDTVNLTEWEKALSYTELARIDLAKGDYQQALIVARKGYDIALDLQTLWDIEQALEVYLNAYAGLGNYKKAFELSQQYIAIKDTLYNQEKNLAVNRQQQEINQIEKEYLESQLLYSEEKRRTSTWIIFSILFLSLFLIAFLVYYRKNLKKNQQLNIALEKSLLELEEINRDKNQIFSIISHDLRGPLNSISSILDMEMEGTLSTEERQRLNSMLYNQLERTRSMMDELLNWANNQLSGIKTSHKRCRLKSVVEEEVYKLQIALQAKSIQVEMHDLTASDQVQCDPDQLSIIIHNLLTNAVKYTHKKGTIYIRSKAVSGKVELTIQDTGIGMSPEVLKKIQSPTDKIKSRAGTEFEQGSGIGLLLTKQLLRLNNIEMAIQSEVGKGSSFKLSFG